MNRLKELRQEKGIRQEDLAKAISVQNYTIGNWERQRSEPNIQDLIKIANYFEVTVDYLIGRTNELEEIKTNLTLTQYEKNLLSTVAKLSRDDQFQVLGFAQALAN